MHTWTSAPLHLNPYTCVDVKADSKGVTLGQVDGVSLHNLHLTAEQTMELAEALTQGAAHCLAAQEA